MEALSEFFSAIGPYLFALAAVVFGIVVLVRGGKITLPFFSSEFTFEVPEPRKEEPRPSRTERGWDGDYRPSRERSSYGWPVALALMIAVALVALVRPWDAGDVVPAPEAPSGEAEQHGPESGGGWSTSAPAPPEPRRERAEPQPRVAEGREPTTYVLNGRYGRFEAIGTFAEGGTHRLTPGSHMTARIYLPSRDGSGSISIDFGPRVIDETGFFKALLPRYIRNLETGETVDLSTRRYRFEIITDEERFRACGNTSRYNIITEGDPNAWFFGADRVFCGNTDPVPDLY